MEGEILKFDLEGKMGCFRKYYSNKNVLSYYLPPRTTIMGILASILELDKDSYYDSFNSKNIGIGIKIKSSPKIYVTPMNHLSSNGGRRQVRHQFLMAEDEKIVYTVYLLFKNCNYQEKLIKRILNKNFGYGISLGQKQFKGYITNTKQISSYEIQDNFSGKISTLTSKENVIDLNLDGNNIIVKELMPMNFKKVKKGREPLEYGEVIFEKSGNNIQGNFKKVYKIENEYITFFEMEGD